MQRKRYRRGAQITAIRQHWESAVKAAEESLATAKKDFRETYLKKYSFVDGDGALGVGRQILAQGDPLYGGW